MAADIAVRRRLAALVDAEASKIFWLRIEREQTDPDSVVSIGAAAEAQRVTATSATDGWAGAADSTHCWATRFVVDSPSA